MARRRRINNGLSSPLASDQSDFVATRATQATSSSKDEQNLAAFVAPSS